MRRQLTEEERLERLAGMQLVTDWRLAAVADGWTQEPTYKHEPVEHAFTLKKDGFEAQGVARPANEKHWANYSLCVWGPDKMQISVPDPYDWERVLAGLTHCPNCGATEVETFRVGFAGRSCAKCLPELKRLHEFPGWAR